MTDNPGLLPFATADLPGVGGRLKDAPADFVVAEIPAYELSGEGEHLYLWVEKTDVAAEQLTQHIARTLGLKPRDIGVAGLKDRRAITRQYVSVPATHEAQIAKLGTEQIRVLEARRHRHKLKTGHLRGNRFEIVLRDVCPDALTRATAIASRISQAGFPNYFGEQRFGRDGSTLETGWQLLRGEITERDLPPARRRFLLRLALSSVQSALFNEVLAARLQDGLSNTVLPGDVLQKVESGGCFTCEDAATDQPRLDSGEVVLTGPLFGPKMKATTGAVAEREATVMAAHQLTDEHFCTFAKLTSGARRPLAVRPTDLAVTGVDDDPTAVRIRVALPSGVYATTLLRELQKTAEPAD